jgi:photosystem II stability/assembly factor-like uncharacterized protein
LAFGLLVSTAFAAPPRAKQEAPKAKTLIHVTLCKVEQAKALAAIKSLGAIQSRSNGVLTVAVKPGLKPSAAVKSLLRLRYIGNAWSDETPKLLRNDLQTVSGLRSALAKFPVEHHDVENRKPVKHLEPEKEEGDRPDYLRALLYYTERRAYPYDRIDWDAYREALDHAAHMPAAGPSRSAASIHPDATTNWQFIGPNNLDVPYRIYYGTRPTSGRLGAVAYDPNTNGTYYLGGAAGGLWKTTDSGVTWKPLGDAWPATPVSSIAVNAQNSQIVYVGTGDFHGGVGLTNGIMKTTDGGKTWTALGVSQFGTNCVSSVTTDPENPSVVLATTCYGPGQTGEVWRSSNGGGTWTQVIPFAGEWTSASVSIADSSGNRTYYAASGGHSTSIYTSADRGQTWTALTTPFSGSATGVNVVASAVDASTVYAFAPDLQQIFKSTNKGSSWTNITGDLVTNSSYNFSQSWYDYYLAVTNNGGSDDLFIGLIDVAESTNGGTNWHFIGQTFTGGANSHNDQHCFAVNPNNPNEILFGNDGGVYRATRSGSAWTITGLSKTLGITMFYHGIFDPADQTKMIGGSQDNATPVSTGDLANWANVGGGDGGFVAVNQANRLIQYCTIYGLVVIQTKDGWVTQNDISPNTGGDGNLPFVTPIYNDPVNTKYLYALSDYLYRFDNNAGVWTSRLGGRQLSNGALIHALAVAPSNGNLIYTGSDDGQLFVSSDGGNTFKNITANLPNRSINSISVDRSNPNSILVGLAGSGAAHLYQCTNAAAKTPSFVPVAGLGLTALPDASLNCIERDTASQATRWYVGTDIGVFFTTDGGKNWTNATNSLGLPIVQVTAIQQTQYGTINIATYGRGMWKIATASLSGGSSGLAPYAVSGIEGTFIPNPPVPTGGVITQLAKDDGNYVIMLSSYDTAQQAQISSFEADYNVGAGSLNSISLSVSPAVSLASTVQIYLYNYQSNRFDFLGQNPSSTNVTNATYAPKGSPSAYSDGNGHVRAIIRILTPGRQGSGSHVLRVDSFTAVAGINGG